PLRRRLDGVIVRPCARPQSLAERLARDVLVCDVDVVAVAAARVRAQAVGVRELRQRLRFAACARAGLALPGDDLDRDVASAAVVACEPDGPRAAAPEGTDWPVPTEEESLFEACCSGFGHVLHPYAAAGQSPFLADGLVTVTLAVGLRL